ncbi:TPA: molecular chaperone DnaK [Candidatus Nomurabacteria bacterium]|nr:molecular chaperone DnaK [Candidatus Nomurabacteria bacterium]
MDLEDVNPGTLGLGNLERGQKPENENEKTRYTDEELKEFKELILDKLKIAQEDYYFYKNSLTQSDGNGVQDTSPTFKVLEEGAATLSKEEAGKLAQRQLKFIQHLQAALIRVENKTYGVCRETGRLIPKERLRVVPHTTLCMDAKKNQYTM